MTRAATLIAAIAALAAALLLLGRKGQSPGSDEARSRADSAWYHASDVALLGRTGRPQLVELFHPD